MNSPDTSRNRSVSNWLFCCAAMIFAMAVIGAITRLTESGLSIMEWAPIKGTLPPLSQAEWQRVFDLYKLTEEFKFENPTMNVAEFRTIFWWEWVHRLWGRLIGLVFALPLVWFWLRGALPAWSKPWLIGALVLGGLQGFMGWFMVHSGFGERTDVSQYRLASHLSLALVLHVYVLMLGLGVRWPEACSTKGTQRLFWPAVLMFGLLSFTLASGAFVAGLNAGYIYNQFPLMGDGLVPLDYSELTPWWRNWFDNPAAAQFNHRLLATLVATLTLALAWFGAKAASGPAKALFMATGTMVLVQYALGIITLLSVVPISLGALHQAGALVLLGLYTCLVYWLRPSKTA